MTAGSLKSEPRRGGRSVRLFPSSLASTRAFFFRLGKPRPPYLDFREDSPSARYCQVNRLQVELGL